MEFLPARLKLVVLAAMTVVTASCTENLDSSSGCPILCPDTGGQVETVTIDAVSLDSTVSALAGQGTEQALLVATRGDTLDSRAIIRFDSIPARYVRPGADTTSTAITTADSVILRVIVDTVGAKLPASVTLDLYDVNSREPDSAVAAIAALFTPGRLIASATFTKAQLKDTINISIPGSEIVSRAGGPLRIGIRARGPQSVQLRILSQEGAANPTVLSFRVSTDTAVSRVSLVPFSKTPATEPLLAASLADYTLLVKGTATGPLTLLNIGGLPARRVYIRFNIPLFLIDSVNVIRATLLLTQQANLTIDPNEQVLILPFVSLATNAVTDVAKASQITAIANTDTLRVTPGGSGLKSLEIASVFNVWRSQNVNDTPRALVLLATTEGASPLEARFFSSEAAPELRPRIRISFSARKSTGLP